MTTNREEPIHRSASEARDYLVRHGGLELAGRDEDFTAAAAGLRHRRARVPGAWNRMRLFATIEDSRVVEQILGHLGLPSDPVRAGPAQPPPLAATDLFTPTLA